MAAMYKTFFDNYLGGIQSDMYADEARAAAKRRISIYSKKQELSSYRYEIITGSWRGGGKIKCHIYEYNPITKKEIKIS